MADLYDLERFLEEQGINYSNPELEPTVIPEPRGFFDPAEGDINRQNVAFKDTVGGEQIGESLGEFLNRIRYQDPKQPLYKSLQTDSGELKRQADARRAAKLNQEMLTSPERSEPPSPLAPPMQMAGPLVQAVQGAATPPAAAQPASPVQRSLATGKEETVPVPTLDGISLSRARDLEQQMGVDVGEEPQAQDARPLSKILEDYQNQIAQEQRSAENRRFAANIGDALSSFVTTATGTPSQSAFFQRLAEQSGQGVEDLKQRLEVDKQKAKTVEEEQLSDPKSSKSVQARQLLEGILPDFVRGIPNFENMSAKALDEALPMLQLRQQLEKEKNTAAYNWAKLQADLQKGSKEDKAKAKQLEAVDTQRTVKNLSDIDTALKRQLELMKKSVTGGTGPLANPLNVKGLFSSDYQALENIFNKINIENMVATFAGMSKAVDSDAERAAWNRTQPSMTLDDNVNVQILLGMQSSLLKDKVIKEAQKEFLNQGGNLAEFNHPILEGNSTTVINPRTGEMVIASKDNIPAGFTDLDAYVEMLTYGDNTPLPRPTGFKTRSQELSEQDRQAMKWAQENKDDPRAQAIMEKVSKKLGQ